MPLTFDPVEARYADDCDGEPGVTFRAHAAGSEPRELVSCRVQKAALDVLLDEASGDGPIEGESALEAAAERFRPIILAVADAKFDRGDWVLDGIRKVVVVRMGDVLTAG